MTFFGSLLTSLLTSLVVSSSVFAKDVALTFDDAPMANGQIYSGLLRTQRFIEVLKKEKIETAFFCNPYFLNVAQGAERLDLYSKAGFTIANHTKSHVSLEKVPASVFIKEIDDADRALSKFPTFKKWFRFPYLKEGKDLATRNIIREHLKQLGYRNGYVTVDSYDYAVNDFVRLARARTGKVDLDNACTVIGDLVTDGLAQEEQLADQHLKSEVSHVVLMHENDLTAYCLDKTIARIRKSGWTIVSPEKAYADTVLAPEPETLWLEQGRVAAAVQAKDGYRFKIKWETPGALEKWLKTRAISPSP